MLTSSTAKILASIVVLVLALMVFLPTVVLTLTVTAMFRS